MEIPGSLNRGFFVGNVKLKSPNKRPAVFVGPGQKQNRVTSAETAANSEQKDKNLFIRQHGSKLNVRCSFGYSS